MAAALPSPVLIRLTLGSSRRGRREHVGLLLEWKQVADGRGVASRQGPVVFALPGPGPGRGRGKAGAWELRQRWMPAEALTPISASLKLRAD